jgi:serine phosphatase RsbU (regulator of sigma subunit)
LAGRSEFNTARSDTRLGTTERLAELNARTIASVGDAIHVIDSRDRIIASTPQGAEIRLANGAAASIGRSWLDVWQGPERGAAKRALQEARAGRVGAFTGRAQREERTAWFDVIVTGMVAAGGISQVLAISRDITLRHEEDAKLRTREAHYRRIALALQAASLPTILPKVDDLDIDGYYIPSAEDVTICGDWYDVMEISAGELLVTIGDVAGHGLSAAVTMTRIKQTIQTAALLTRDPKAILKIANQTMRQMDDSLFATALVGIFNASRRRLDMSSAGHPPPLLREPDGTVRECELLAAAPLGVETTREPSLAEVSLSRGTAMVMFTDGLVEWDRNISTGYRRLSRVLSRNDVIWSSHPSKRIAEAVLGESSPRDDIAILVLREGWMT